MEEEEMGGLVEAAAANPPPRMAGAERVNIYMAERSRVRAMHTLLYL